VQRLETNTSMDHMLLAAQLASGEPRVRDPVKRLLARTLNPTDSPDRAGVS
jgi:hypothetical protein